MNPNVVVVHVVDRQGGNMVLNLLREAVGQPSEAAHVHPHGEVLALDVASVDMLLIRVPGDDLGFTAKAGCGAVALLAFDTVPVNLDQHGVVALMAEAEAISMNTKQIEAYVALCELGSIHYESASAIVRRTPDADLDECVRQLSDLLFCGREK